MVKVNLTDEDLAPRGENNYFAEGEHPVVIARAERGTTDAGKEYVEFTVQGQNGEEDTARLWFTTEKSCKYALSIMAGIASHNKQTEAEKQKVRDAYKAIKDTDLVDAKFLDNFEGFEAFFTVYKSDRTYQTTTGETRNSYDKNIYGYMPKPRTVTPLVSKGSIKEDGSIDLSEIPFE